MSNTRADLRSLMAWQVCLLVLLAALVLLLRAVGLLVCAVVDLAERIEAAASSAAGIAPLAASLVLLPDGGGWR